ncbi:transient receptor potential cation channel subfamily V member 5 isoform X3 [Eurytemora carolleeae]|uniref:transient receptor potential cation channel subfamily V member 5 isoform X3 n=1 Tax=Eurytemora carolleeae TaxID=1294199 RepID=UPI000C778CA0|nr:transient receptor potential cation channel subfamily V member 5 isoform X3 [Eurytemora carolleeae]|eukprot:XP_023321114.1 transient receptor potential cation channel subfamily V member 5-like isoform X3 [Eurytemora affinis]
MGNCMNKKNIFNPGAVLDRVIASASPEDDCLLYKLANFKKSGQLVEAFNTGGSKEVERIIREKLYPLMYNQGKGELITRTEYLRWKYRNNEKNKINIEEKMKTLYDPLNSWEDHQACWRMQYRGSLGESLLHVLIICDSPIHTRIARLLLKVFPKCALDRVEGEEYLGATGLHLAIAYGNDELADILVSCGASIRERAIGVFFLPRDQQSNRPVKNTTYEGLAYMGEYPLAWAACLGNETIYNLLLDQDANPDDQDAYGNTVLHMVVVTVQLGMYGYALRHPRKNANPNIKNNRGLTSLTLSCELGRDNIFREMLELSCKEFWRYSNITCCGYPLGALDSIQPDGETNWGSALMIILNGTKEEHLNMLEGGIIAKLLEEKWKTFAQGMFLKRTLILLLHLITMSTAIYTRPDIHSSLLNGIKPRTGEMSSTDISRYCFEVATIISVLTFLTFQLGGEIKNAGVSSFWRNLKSSPPKMIFVISNLLILGCIPLRVAQLGEESAFYRTKEEALLVFAVPGSWFYLMFFAGAVKLTGPFVTMIFSMITGDMFTFSIIYVIFLFGFSQAFYFMMKSMDTEGSELYDKYTTTWIALFHMTLGEYEYDLLGESPYPNMAKIVFVLFQILIPILLLNMLIAMMGNTYATVIEKSEKEFLKQWAKVIMSMERSIPPHQCREYLEAYSITLGPTERGVMVIKSKDKTRARQRKGALSNWKKTGKTVIKYLKKRGISGDDLRREMWVHDEAETPKAARKKKGRGYDISFALGEVEPKLTPLTVKAGGSGNIIPRGASNQDLDFLCEQENGSSTTGNFDSDGFLSSADNRLQSASANIRPTSTDSRLPPINLTGRKPDEVGAMMSEISGLKTPRGGIKVDRERRRKDLFNKKRSRKELSKRLLSMDFSLLEQEQKQESDSEEDDIYTGSRGIENPAFLPTEDPPSYGSFTVVSEIPE